MKETKTKKPRITDWIQAVMAILGTSAAIVGLIIAWLSLTKSDKELQKQIDKLDIVATQSLEHTKLLTDQVILLTDELDFQKQQNEISLSHRQIDIEPKLIVEFEYFNGDIVSAKLINNGKSAKIIKVVEKKLNEFQIDIPFQYIGEGKEKPIFFKYKKPQERNEKTALDFTLIYQDIDNKIKSKEFSFIDIEGIIEKKNKSNIMIN